MCVTSAPAHITNTRTYVYATSHEGRPVHVSGYQNEAETRGPNCMFLNFAGKNLKMVHGPERTRGFMRDMTAGLQELEYVESFRGGFLDFGASRGVSVENYGDYTVILAQEPADILSVLDQVPQDRQPPRTKQLEQMVKFYMSWYSDDSFVLACFNGNVKPKHPITVQYEPRDTTVLTVPGLDGHTGAVPRIGEPVQRDFHVAFAIEGAQLPHTIWYDDPVRGTYWAPDSVAGFVDNRLDGPNGDYAIHVAPVIAGMTGKDLARQLIDPLA